MKAEAIDAEHLEVLLLKGRVAELSRRVDLARRYYEQFLAKAPEAVVAEQRERLEAARAAADKLAAALERLQAA